MKLIGTYLSPFARRVAAALISRGFSYEHEDLNGYVDPERARALNPVGKVPVLVLDGGECLIDSAAILDHINELVAPDQALVPGAGAGRRIVLRLSAIAVAICEQSSARYFEERRANGCCQPDLLERYRLQAIGGLRTLDAASGPEGCIGTEPLSLATISAVVAFDYARMTHPDLDPPLLVPSLAAVAERLAERAPFARTRPQSF